MKFLATEKLLISRALVSLEETVNLLIVKILKSTKFKYSEYKTFERLSRKLHASTRNDILIRGEKIRKTGSMLPRVLARGTDAIKLQSLEHRQTICTKTGNFAPP